MGFVSHVSVGSGEALLVTIGFRYPSQPTLRERARGRPRGERMGEREMRRGDLTSGTRVTPAYGHSPNSWSWTLLWGMGCRSNFGKRHARNPCGGGPHSRSSPEPR